MAEIRKAKKHQKRQLQVNQTNKTVLQGADKHRPATTGGPSRPANRWTESSSFNRWTESSSFNGWTKSSSFTGGQNRPASGGQNRPASTGGQNRPASTGGPNRPASTGGPSRPASTGGQIVQLQRWTKSSSFNGWTESSSFNTTGGSSGPASRPAGSRAPGPGRRGGRPPARGINQGRRRYRPAPAAKVQLPLPDKITFYESVSVAGLAQKLGREPSEILKKLLMLGVMATINEELEKDAIELICSDYGVEVEEEIRIDVTDLDIYFEETEGFEEEVSSPENIIERAPVVTIMGHVDHGKTTLLDSIRNTKVTQGEAGGITQHIGAYQIDNNGKKVTFLDTPGHAAFTTMRARGASITDITILVVAADDGVMPQTVEAINHAQAADVPIIVAVNKIDKPAANPERVMQELTEHGLLSEEWGGDTIFVPISALTGEGIDTLLEMVLLVAEIAELKADLTIRARGSVIEAELDRGRGAVATLLVQNGTLKVGDPIVVGNTFGRVRAMISDTGRRVQSAEPSTPVEITGLERCSKGW